MELNKKLPYEKPVLNKHAQLREVTLSSTGGDDEDEDHGNGNGNGNKNGNH